MITESPEETTLRSASGSRTLVVPVPDPAGNAVLPILRATPHQAHPVQDARTAKDALREETFDVVLLDLTIPGSHAERILEDLKCDSQVWDVPVIAVGSPERLEDVLRCLDLGAEDFLLEPLHPVLMSLRIDAFRTKRRLLELEAEYIKIFEEQRADLTELKRELTQRIMRELEDLSRLSDLQHILPSALARTVANISAEAAG